MNETDRNGPGAKPRRVFDDTYKRHAVELTLSPGRTIKAIAKELGMAPGALYSWRKQFASRIGLNGIADHPRNFEESEEENRRLRAEVIRLREREIVLKKSLGILSETPESGMPKLKR